MPPDSSGDWSKSLTLTWDGWNRIVKVVDDATEVAAYQYDGLYRRTTRTVSGVIHHCYFSNRWKLLEERLDASTSAERQYLWGARPEHRDELILRDRDTDNSGTLDERLYCAMDFFSPTAMFDTSGVVQERYGFSGFGIRRILAPDFSDRATSCFEVDFAFHGQFLDEETGWYDYGYRYYSPAIGRWLTRDPIQERGGVNLYGIVGNSAINRSDVLGLLFGCDD
ncbi:MAG: RHS repeat-associated core domain-containing protein, partial [Verrucomicrobiota bacterium]